MEWFHCNKRKYSIKRFYYFKRIKVYKNMRVLIDWFCRYNYYYTSHQTSFLPSFSLPLYNKILRLCIRSTCEQIPRKVMLVHRIDSDDQTGLIVFTQSFRTFYIL